MVGTTISHYKVIEKIGQGGVGEVYRTTTERELEYWIRLPSSTSSISSWAVNPKLWALVKKSLICLMIRSIWADSQSG